LVTDPKREEKEITDKNLDGKNKQNQEKESQIKGVSGDEVKPFDDWRGILGSRRY
jgi:hypothetical protein